MRTRLLITALLLAASGLAQDPNFSQFYNNPVYYNPSMTAINNGMAIRLNARSLWGPIPGRFNTFSFSAEAQTMYKMGLGIMAYSDVGGEALLRTAGGYVNYSYRPVDTKNFILQAGVSGGFVTKNIDWSKLTFSDQLDETMGKYKESSFVRPGYNSVSYADFSTGLVMRFNGTTRKQRGSFKRFNATLGAGIHHLSQPKDAFLGDREKLPLKLVFHTQANLLFNEFIVSPGAVFEMQNEFKTFSIGSNFVSQPFIIGIWFRNRTAAMSVKQYDSFIFTLGLNMRSKYETTWRVTYNFDMTISRLKTSSYGSHELSLLFEIPNRVLFSKNVNSKNMRRRYQCPKEFSGM
ncbi:PorP/SprF family type IX secretion system membrane protein [Fluviicola sp.]|uniref:PorP/SprF family type IX secretion system membrane protein n=1 Tax=Fluviicola sp. TaxID=1917219 RepID=UPI0031CFD518